MSIKIIACLDSKKGVAKNGDMPWYIKSEFQHFKKTTMGFPIIMGRKTFDSLPIILPGRHHIVLSHTTFASEENISYVKSLAEALYQGKKIASTKEDIFIIGGVNIWQQALKHNVVDECILSILHDNYSCDRFFPDLDKDWSLEDLESFEEFDVHYFKNKG